MGIDGHLVSQFKVLPSGAGSEVKCVVPSKSVPTNNASAMVVSLRNSSSLLIVNLDLLQ